MNWTPWEERYRAGDGPVRQVPLTDENVARAMAVMPPNERDSIPELMGVIRQAKPQPLRERPVQMPTPTRAVRPKKCLMIEWRGETHTLREWESITGIQRRVLNQRKLMGKTGDELFAPCAPRLKTAGCGTATRYRGGCHCAVCTEAKRLECVAYRARKKGSA